VEQKYKRVENLDTKIKDISLPYIEWKVLFLTAEDTSQDELGELIKENSEEIAGALKSLEEKGLIELAESLAEEESEEEEALPEEQVDLDEEAQEMAPSEMTEQEDEKEEEMESIEVAEDGQEEELDIASEIKEESEDFDDVSETDQESLSLEEEKEVEETESDQKAEATELLRDLDESIGSSEESEQDLESMITEAEAPEDEATNAEQDLVSMITEAEAPVGEETEAEIAEEAVVEESEEEEPSESEEYISDVSKQSILVIDDSIVIRKMIEIALEEEDYRIITATSGKDGMEVIEKENPNLIILDMILPDMNGIEVLKQIKTGHKSPVIMLSGKDAPQLVESAKEVGVEDFLPKPFRDEELVEKVKNLLG
jgi:CheY-like chemotaxis protein